MQGAATYRVAVRCLRLRSSSRRERRQPVSIARRVHRQILKLTLQLLALDLAPQNSSFSRSQLALTSNSSLIMDASSNTEHPRPKVFRCWSKYFVSPSKGAVFKQRSCRQCRFPRWVGFGISSCVLCSESLAARQSASTILSRGCSARAVLSCLLPCSRCCPHKEQ
jgi:hypothetical protein